MHPFRACFAQMWARGPSNARMVHSYTYNLSSGCKDIINKSYLLNCNLDDLVKTCDSRNVSSDGLTILTEFHLAGNTSARLKFWNDNSYNYTVIKNKNSKALVFNFVYRRNAFCTKPQVSNVLHLALQSCQWPDSALLEPDPLPNLKLKFRGNLHNVTKLTCVCWGPIIMKVYNGLQFFDVLCTSASVTNT